MLSIYGRWITAFFVQLLFHSVCSNSLMAGQAEDVATVKQQAIRLQLGQKKVWNSLLHYRKDRFSFKASNEIDNADFFLASPDTPEQELLATLAAIFSPLDEHNAHVQCRYPARFQWLNKKLMLTQYKSLPKPHCWDLDKWLAQFDADSLVLVFPSAYLRQPSSMFGHSFLRFDAPPSMGQSTLLSQTINFAADVRNASNTFSYIYKGLFGGYPGMITVEPFYKRIREYSDDENRDIWLYRLNFSPDQVKLVLLHTWEVLGGIFDYYFLDENCSYRVLSFIDVALEDIDLLQEFNIHAAPVDTIRALTEQGLVSNVEYLPSAHKQFYQRSQKLTAAQQMQAYRLVKNKQPIKNQLDIISRENQANILAVATEYLALLVRMDAIDRKVGRERRAELIAARLELPKIESIVPVARPNTSPDLAHANRRLGLSVGEQDGKPFNRYSYRESYHSFDDPTQGFERGVEVEVLGLSVKQFNGKELELDEFTLLSITSLSARDVFFKPASWAIDIGRKPMLLSEDVKLTNFARGERGWSYWRNEHAFYLLGTAALEVNRQLNYGRRLRGGVRMGVVYRVDRYSYDVGFLSEYNLGGESEKFKEGWLNLTVPLGKDLAVSGKYTWKDNVKMTDEQLRLDLQYYF